MSKIKIATVGIILVCSLSMCVLADQNNYNKYIESFNGKKVCSGADVQRMIDSIQNEDGQVAYYNDKGFFVFSDKESQQYRDPKSEAFIVPRQEYYIKSVVVNKNKVSIVLSVLK